MKQLNKLYYTREIEKREIVETGYYRSLDYLIVSNGRCPTAYVIIPVGWREIIDDDEIDCHGGITYFEDKLDVFPLEDGTTSFIGWDYAHYGDYGVGCSPREGKKWTIEEIEIECKQVIDQILHIVLNHQEYTAFSISAF